MITPEQHAEIRRLYFGEHWKVGTIAAALGVHHDTVRAAIAHDTQTVAARHVPRHDARSLSALHPRHAGAVSASARDAPLRDGARPRLHRLGRPAPARGAHAAARGDAHRLSPLDDADGGRGAGRLGRVRLDPDWPWRAPALRLCDGAVVFARACLRSSRSTRRSRVFSAGMSRPSRRFRAWRAPWSTTTSAAPCSNAQGSAIRFHPRLLELAGHYHFAPRPCTPGRGKREGENRAANSLPPPRLLCGADVCRCRRSERAVSPLARRDRASAPASRAARSDGRAGPRRRSSRGSCRSPRIPSTPT